MRLRSECGLSTRIARAHGRDHRAAPRERCRPTELAQEMESEKRGVALVKMIGADVEAESLQREGAADPQHEFPD